MNIDVYSAAGAKKGTLELPEALFGARINPDLMHQALVRQQSNRRNPIAHVKTRGEVKGTTKKAYAQKHTGRARRGSVRSPLLRGGGKAFGPRNTRNFVKDMPKSMRRAALLSCLTLQAKKGSILGLEGYPETIKTKDMHGLLKKLPIEIGRRILFVLPQKHDAFVLSSRNIPRIKTLQVQYLNPEDVLGARSIVFVGDSVAKAVELFGKEKAPRAPKAPTAPKMKAPRAPKAPKKAVKKTSAPSKAS